MTLPGIGIVLKCTAALCLVLAVALGWQTIVAADLRTDLAKEQRDRASDRAAAALGAANGIDAALTEYKQRITDQQEIIDGQAKTIARVRADAVAAVGSAHRLRDRADQLAAGCGGGAADTAAADPGAPAAAAGHLLADMLSRIDDAARDIAEFADESSTAGTTCEHTYDALRRRL